MNWIAIPLAGVTVLSTLAGGLTAVRLRRDLTTAIALTGGIVVAVALFDVLPEAIDSVNDSRRVTTLVGAGFLAFFLAERLVVLHHRDEAEQAQAHAQVGALGAAGLSLHSFIDGLGIGLAFQLNTATGLLVFLAVVTHDFADGLNTVNFVLSQGGDLRRALRWLAVDSLAPLVGATVGVFVTVSEHSLGQLLAVYAGFFLFMGATDLLPEAHEHPSWKRVALTATGFVATFLIAWIASRALGVGRQPLLRELEEAGALGVVRAKRRVIGVSGVVGDLLGDRAHLVHDLLAMLRVEQQLLRPRGRVVGGLDFVLDEQATEQDPHPDVGEGSEGQQLARRVDERLDLRVLALDVPDDRADRLVDERDPDLFVIGHVKKDRPVCAMRVLLSGRRPRA